MSVKFLTFILKFLVSGHLTSVSVQLFICIYFTGTISISCHRMFFNMDETFWMKELFFLASCNSAKLEEWGTADTMVVMDPPEAFVAVTIMFEGSNSFLGSIELSSEPLTGVLIPGLKVNLSRFVVLFFLYLMPCLDLAPVAWDLFGSRKLRLFATGFETAGLKDAWVEYFSCSFCMSLLWDLDSRPWSTASAWEVTSACRDARSRRIRLTRTRSQFSPLLSLLSFESFMILTTLRIWSPNIFALRESEKHLPKILSQSIPKNLTLGSMSK